MTSPGARSGIINYLRQKHVYIILYFVFVLLFFVSLKLRWYCNFYYALIIPVYLLSIEKNKFGFFFGSKIWLIAMFLLVYLMLTILWGKNPGDEGPVYYLRKGLYLFVFFSLSMELVLIYPRFIDHLFVFLAWVGTITALVSIASFYHAAPFPSARLEYIAGQFNNPILGAITYGMIILIIYFHIIKTSRRRSRQWLYGALMIVITGSVLLTQSRGPLAILLISFILGGLITKDIKLLLALGCIIIVGGAIVLSNKQARDMITDRGMSYRIELAEKTMEMARGDLVFGKGITTDHDIIANDGRDLHHPHNFYLAMILYGGITGLTILLLLLATAIRESWRHYRLTKDFTFFILIVFGAGSIINSQDNIITHPHPVWFYFWLPLALLAGVSCKERGKGILPVTTG